MGKLKIADAFGAALWNHHHTGDTDEIIETRSGFIWVNRGGMQMYFAPYSKWTRTEKTAIKHVTGAVLDIGCGAGRHCLWLERNGRQVTAIDSSFLATEVTKLRGAKDVRWLPLERITELKGVRYDSILMLGNGLGLFGTISKTKRLLDKLAQLTTTNGIIVGDSVDPKCVDPGVFRNNTAKEKFKGQMSIRFRHRDKAGPWFNYSYISFNEIERIIKETGWIIREHIKGSCGHYAVVLVKK